MQQWGPELKRCKHLFSGPFLLTVNCGSANTSKRTNIPQWLNQAFPFLPPKGNYIRVPTMYHIILVVNRLNIKLLI